MGVVFAVFTAIAAFVFGWGLTIAGFCLPVVGQISESVLWVLGQALVYAASVFGVAMYTTGSVRGMKKEISHFIEEEHNRLNNPEMFEDEIDNIHPFEGEE